MVTIINTTRCYQRYIDSNYNKPYKSKLGHNVLKCISNALFLMDFALMMNFGVTMEDAYPNDIDAMVKLTVMMEVMRLSVAHALTLMENLNASGTVTVFA